MKTISKMPVILSIVGLSLILALFISNPVSAKTFRLVIGGGWPLPPTAPNFAKMVIKEVEARTQHKIRLVEAHGGSVAKPGEGLEAVRDGLLNVGAVAWPFNPNEMFLHNWGYALPFSSSDPVLAYQVGVQTLDQVPYLKSVFEEKYNQKLLACATSGAYHMLTTFPVKSIDDLRNRKIAGAGPNLSWLKDIGAVPVQGSAMEAYTSLQTGVFDGTIVSTNVATMTRMYEIAKYWSFWDMGDFLAVSYNINLNYWNSLPGELQDIFLEVGKKYGAENAKWLRKETERQIALMKESGVVFYQIPFREKARWANAMQNYAERFIGMAESKGLPGEELVKTYISNLEKEGYRFPRRWVNP